MTKSDDKLLRRAAISELERLSEFFDAELEVTASVSVEEAEADLRELGHDPDQPLPRPVAYVYVSDEPLRDECAGEVKLMILEIRYLTRQRRYAEALDLAVLATETAPHYWRAWISRASLLVLFGRVEAGERIFERVLEEFSDNAKAVAAGLHGRAWVRDIKCGLDPSGEDLREVSRLYEQALELDDSRANTRACLLIHSLMNERSDNDRRLLEESVMCEGFFDELRFEMAERGARAVEVLRLLPSWLRRLLYPIRPLLDLRVTGDSPKL